MPFSIRQLSTSQRQVMSQLGLKAWCLREQEASPYGAKPEYHHSASSEVKGYCVEGKTLNGASWCLLCPSVANERERQLLDNWMQALGAQLPDMVSLPGTLNEINSSCQSVLLIGLAETFGLTVDEIQSHQGRRCLVVKSLDHLLSSPDYKQQVWQWTRELLL